MYSDILTLVKTSSDREVLLTEIDLLKESLFEPKKGIEIALKNEVRLSISEIIRAHIEKGEDLQAYLEGLAQALGALGEVRVELAGEPTEKVIELVYAWLADKVGRNIIVTLAANPLVLGGAIVSFKGKYYDGSLKRIVDETLEQQKTGLLKAVYSSK